MIPTPWVVGRRVWSHTGTDAHGNDVPVFSGRVPVRVHAVAPRVREGAAEPGGANRSLVVEGLQVFAPAGTVFGPHDRLVWPFDPDDPAVGVEFDVDGEVADYTRGPWLNPVAGVVINVTRSEG